MMICEENPEAWSPEALMDSHIRRVQVGKYWLDLKDTEATPTVEEIAALLNPPPSIPSKQDLQAQVATLTAQVNALKNGSP